MYPGLQNTSEGGNSLPKRTRLFAKDYILDIVEADYGSTLYYYTVHSRTTGEIFTLGHETTYQLALAAALYGFRTLTGQDLEFEEVKDRSAAAS